MKRLQNVKKKKLKHFPHFSRAFRISTTPKIERSDIHSPFSKTFLNTFQVFFFFISHNSPLNVELMRKSPILRIRIGGRKRRRKATVISSVQNCNEGLLVAQGGKMAINVEPIQVVNDLILCLKVINHSIFLLRFYVEKKRYNIILYNRMKFFGILKQSGLAK